MRKLIVTLKIKLKKIGTHTIQTNCSELKLNEAFDWHLIDVLLNRFMLVLMENNHFPNSINKSIFKQQIKTTFLRALNNKFIFNELLYKNV